MVSQTERVMARRQVDAEIRANPITIIPHRKTKVDDGAGGWTWGPDTPLEPIVITIIPAKRRLTDFLVNAELGNVVHAPYILLGYYDCGIQRDDKFTWRGDEFIVRELELETEISITAPIDYYGGASNG